MELSDCLHLGINNGHSILENITYGDKAVSRQQAVREDGELTKENKLDEEMPLNVQTDEFIRFAMEEESETPIL